MIASFELEMEQKEAFEPTRTRLNKLHEYHVYVEELLGRPIFTHELRDPKIQSEIKDKEAQKGSFYNLELRSKRMDEILHTKLGPGLDRDPLQDKTSVSAVASNDGVISDVATLEIINTAIGTATSIINMSDNKHVQDMAANIADSLIALTDVKSL